MNHEKDCDYVRLGIACDCDNAIPLSRPVTLHDELLAKIDNWKFQTKGYEDTYEVHGILSALHAVVELHTGFSTGECTDPECCSSGPDYLCNECQEDYPCPTIQAIEKELK